MSGVRGHLRLTDEQLLTRQRPKEILRDTAGDPPPAAAVG